MYHKNRFNPVELDETAGYVISQQELFQINKITKCTCGQDCGDSDSERGAHGGSLPTDRTLKTNTERKW